MKELKKKLQEIIQNDKGHNYYDDDGNCLFYYESVEAIAEQSYNLALEDRWIPVSKRLPEMQDRYLVINPFYHVVIANYVFDSGEWRFYHNGEQINAIYWQPLPALPSPPNTESK
jgi:hypothetical protein